MEKQKKLEKEIYIDDLNGATIQEWLIELLKYEDAQEARVCIHSDEYDTSISIKSYVLETDEEQAERIRKEKSWQDSLKENRYKSYLKLKEEFENDKTDSTVQDN